MASASLERVLARPGMGGVTLRHVRAMLAEDLAKRWVDDQDGTTVITQLVQTPDGVNVAIWLAEGTLPGCMRLLDRIEAYALQISARRVRVTGRAGWVRQLRDRGYLETARIMERELQPAGVT